jgi:hypothetical protein
MNAHINCNHFYLLMACCVAVAFIMGFILGIAIVCIVESLI